MIRRTWLWCAVLVVGGCAPGNSGLVIGNVVAPSDTCLYETSNPQRLSGILDVGPAFTDPPQRVTYTIRVVYFNQLTNLSRGGTGVPIADPNVMWVEQAQVELRDFNGTPLVLEGLPNPYRVPATGFVPSSDGMTAGEGLGAIEIIPPFYGAALARAAIDSTIVAAVQAIGRTAGDAEVIAPEFEWPIDVCAGCLYACQEIEEERVCMPSCTPGQDTLSVTPGACEDPPVFGGCLTGS